MQTTVSVLLLLLGLTNAQQDVYHHQNSEQYGLRIPQAEGQLNGPTDYIYSYDVRDDITGDRKSQEESRYGDQVRGRYSLLDADGSTRTVEYSVDSLSGFNAVVRRDGDQISVPDTNSRPIAYTLSGYNRRTSAPELFRNRHQSDRTSRLDTRTRLAQDSRTGNVVDLHSGFGVAPHVSAHLLPTPVPRIHQANLENIGNANQNQIRTSGYETHEIQNEDVQEILARSHYQTSLPINEHHSTAPIHFPGFMRGYGSHAELAYNRYSIRPATHVDVRRPTPVFPNTDNRNRGEEGRSNENNAQNLQQESNYHNSNNLNENSQYPSQQEEVRGPTTPIPVHPTFGPQSGYLESNYSRSSYHQSEPEYLVARINNQNAIQNIDTGSIHDDSVITSAIVTPLPILSTAYPEAYVTPAPAQIYQEDPRLSTSDHSNTEISVSNHQSYLYPASTLPLNDVSPGHFFTGENLAANGVSPLFHDYDLHNSLYDHVAANPVHFSEPIAHDVHVLN